MPRLHTPLLLALALAGCEASPPPLEPAEEARVRELGREAASTLQATLAPRLMQAIREGGAAQAVGFCAVAADSLTRAGAGSGIEVKRTSRRVRNPANAPDRWEREALAYFHALDERGDSVPAGWVQPVSGEEARFYAPLRIAPLCLNCHGDPADLAPGVGAILEELYPRDRATGYAAGELRGLIRVSIPRP